MTGQGRVVGGHLSGGVILSGGTGAFSKNNDLSIQHHSSLFKKFKINDETVVEWEELVSQDGVAGTMGRAAATAALPGRIGKAVGAGLGAAANSGHTVRVAWADGKQSIIQLPGKQFMVLSVLLGQRQLVTDQSNVREPEPASVEPGVTEKLADIALSVLGKGKQETGETATAAGAPSVDVADQIAKLGALHAQGILTDAEFSEKKAELLKRM
jgi:hypothetical protein